MFWHLARELRNAGVLGINRRNADFTLACNARHLYPLVDDKLITKRLAQQHGLPVPSLYFAVEHEYELAGLPARLAPFHDFVIKPARGSGGDGILIVVDSVEGRYQKASGVHLDQAQLRHHVASVLSGMYSLGGQPDHAMVEARVKFDPVFEQITYQGVPDIRLIVYRGVPAMAMLRLPTLRSDGKANLHQGAVGAGVAINSGRTMTAVQRNHVVQHHPDTGNPVTGVEVPYWQRILEMAAQCCDLTGLGYLGVDIVLDRELGPLVLELNARPGLNIQIANRAGLVPRLEQVDRDVAGLKTVEEKVAYARRSFA